MKKKYLLSYELDKSSRPTDFGPIIKFDKVLFEPMYFDDKEKQDKQAQGQEKVSSEDLVLSIIRDEPLAIKALKKKLESEEEPNM